MTQLFTSDNPTIYSYWHTSLLLKTQLFTPNDQLFVSDDRTIYCYWHNCLHLTTQRFPSDDTSIYSYWYNSLLLMAQLFTPILCSIGSICIWWHNCLLLLTQPFASDDTPIYPYWNNCLLLMTQLFTPDDTTTYTHLRFDRFDKINWILKMNFNPLLTGTRHGLSILTSPNRNYSLLIILKNILLSISMADVFCQESNCHATHAFYWCKVG